MAHLSKDALFTALSRASARVEVGAFYTHYKNPLKRYQVIHLAVMEADDSIAVLYQTVNDSDPEIVFVRSVESFLETVTHEGVVVNRFSKIT